MNKSILIPPNGKRTKPIIIEGVFRESDLRHEEELLKILTQAFVSFDFFSNKLITV